MVTKEGLVVIARVPGCPAVLGLVTELESKDCYKLLGCDLSTPEGHAAFKQGNLNKRCAKLVGRATEIAAEIVFTSLKSSLKV
jgi:hypothetical protein